MKRSPLLVLTLCAVALLISGCQHLAQNLESAKWETGPRWDEDGELTDDSQATVKLWSSKDKD